MHHKSISEEIDFLYEKYYSEYKRKICSKCMGTQQQKERECGVLTGCSDVCCDQMENAIKARKKYKTLVNQWAGAMMTSLEEKKAQYQRNESFHEMVYANSGEE